MLVFVLVGSNSLPLAFNAPTTTLRVMHVLMCAFSVFSLVQAFRYRFD